MNFSFVNSQPVNSPRKVLLWWSPLVRVIPNLNSKPNSTILTLTEDFTGGILREEFTEGNCLRGNSPDTFLDVSNVSEFSVWLFLYNGSYKVVKMCRAATVTITVFYYLKLCNFVYLWRRQSIAVRRLFRLDQIFDLLILIFPSSVRVLKSWGIKRANIINYNCTSNNKIYFIEYVHMLHQVSIIDLIDCIKETADWSKTIFCKYLIQYCLYFDKQHHLASARD